MKTLFLFLVIFNFVSGAEAQSSHELPDDTYFHNRDTSALERNEGAIEWDSRMFWLKSESGKNFGMMVMSTHRGVHLGFPYYSVESADTAFVSISDEAGHQSNFYVSGEFDKNFNFKAQSATDHWTMTRDSVGSAVRVSAPGLEIALDATAQKKKTYLHDFGSTDLGWISWDSGTSVPWVDQTNLKVQGTLNFQGERMTVSGSSWMERNWTTSHILDAMASNWRWRFFFFQFQEGTGESEMLAFQLTDPTTQKVTSTYGAIIRPDSSLLVLDPSRIEITPTKTKTLGDKTYETAWSLRFKDDSDLRVDLTYIPTLPWIEYESLHLCYGHFDGPCRMTASREVNGQRVSVDGHAWCEQVSTEWAHLCSAPPQ
jgi:hypothetical protein